MNPQLLFYALQAAGINFFCGVPDSILSSFCDYLVDKLDDEHHIIAANEGGAIALGIGHYLATGQIAGIYMQNSGLGNAINPLLSLASNYVYSVPLLLIIGWRGELEGQDEPQHTHQGKVMLDMLKVMNIHYFILGDKEFNNKELINESVQLARNQKSPVALILRKNILNKTESEGKRFLPNANLSLTREDALSCIINSISNNDVIIASTGMISREVFEIIKESGHIQHKNSFLTIGGMGHTSQIALAISLARQDKNVYCLDGDGSMIMHMGSLSIAAQVSKNNFKYLLINNGMHQSVGGQPTVGFKINMCQIARSFGFDFTKTAVTKKQIKDTMNKMKKHKFFLEIQVNSDYRKNLSRPSILPYDSKKDFMEFLLYEKTKNIF